MGRRRNSGSTSFHVPDEMPQLPFSNNINRMAPRPNVALQGRLERRHFVATEGRGSAPIRRPIQPPGRSANNMILVDEKDKQSYLHARKISVESGAVELLPSEKRRDNHITPTGPSPTFVSQVPIACTPFASPKYPKPAARPPPPPRQSPTKSSAKYSPPPRIHSDSRRLGMNNDLANAKLPLPLVSSSAAASAKKATLRTTPEEFQKSQLYPPPPPKRQPSSGHSAIGNSVQNNGTHLRRSQVSTLGEDNNESNLTILRDIRITPQDKPQDASCLLKTKRQTSHAQAVIALVNPSSSDAPHSKVAHQNNQHQQHNGFRQDYLLGETARSSSHMRIEPCAEKATETIDSLAKHDFAFVKRTDGSYSYAILAHRSNEESKNQEIVEECMTFALSNAGCTKMIKKSQWSKFVRLASSSSTKNYDRKEDLLQPKKATGLLRSNDKIDNEPEEVKSDHDVEEYLKKIRQEFYSTRPVTVGDGWVPPSTILFNALDDDLISCVSTCDYVKATTTILE